MYEFKNKMWGCVPSWVAVDGRRNKIYHLQNRSTFRKVWAPAEGQNIILVLAFDYHELQAPDPWLSASVQAGFILPFLVSFPKGSFKVHFLEIETKPLWRGWFILSWQPKFYF